MSSWTDKFGKGGMLESTDGATYNLQPIEDPKAPKQEDVIPFNVGSLAQQLAERKAEQDEEYRLLHRNQPPKALDEDEAFFLEAIQREEQIKDDLKRKQSERDIESFNKAVQNRVIKLNDDSNKIKPIDFHSQKVSAKESLSQSLIIAPSVHSSDKCKVNLEGIVLLKKKKKKRVKKKKKNKRKRKLKDINVSQRKKAKVNVCEEQSTNEKKLSEWEHDID